MNSVLARPAERSLWTVLLRSEPAAAPAAPPRVAGRSARPRPATGGDSATEPADPDGAVLAAARRLVPEERLLDLCRQGRLPARHGRAVALPPGQGPLEVLLATTYITARETAPPILFVPSDLPLPDTGGGGLLDELLLLVRLAQRFDQVTVLATRRPLHPESSFPLRLETMGARSGAFVPPRVASTPGEGGGGMVASGAAAAETVWSTGCFAAPAAELWRLARRHMPELAERCQELRLVLRARDEGRLPEDVEPRLVRRLVRLDRGDGFLRRLAATCPEAIRVLPAPGWHREAS